MDLHKDPLDAALGERIRIRRRQLGLTQLALGSQLNLTFQQVQKYESGANRISFSTLARIAAILKCRVSDLVGDLDQSIAATTLTSLAPDVAAKEVHQLIKAYGNIESAPVRRSLLKLARALAARDGDDES